MLPPARVTVGKNVGLHVSWFVYRGKGAVTFSPEQIKSWEDTRAGANSPWAPVWVAPPLPADGKVTVQATFSEPGVYVLRSRADDGALTADGQVTIVTVRLHSDALPLTVSLRAGPFTFLPFPDPGLRSQASARKPGSRRFFGSCSCFFSHWRSGTCPRIRRTSPTAQRPRPAMAARAANGCEAGNGGHDADGVLGGIQQRVTSRVDEQKNRAADGLGGIADVFRSASNELRNENETLASYVDMASDQMRRFADKSASTASPTCSTTCRRSRAGVRRCSSAARSWSASVSRAS